VTRALETHKNAVWAVLLGLTVVLLVVTGGRARAARGAADAAAAEERTLLPADKLTPVPMSVEMTGAPTKPPLSFVSAFANSGPRKHLASSEESAIVARARLEIDKVTVYDNTWMETSSYPMGDVPSNRGACTDVVVRSLREIGIDLQELVHEDLIHDLHGYGLGFVDSNIDHRRVSTMFTFFSRNAMSLTTDVRDKNAWRAGDIVFVAWQWARGAPPEHVGIISDRIGPRGLPLVIENGGPKAVEQDSLGHGKVVGHFRALKKLDAQAR
jgi:uncharacterized protein YijF (DUF1287 family)